MLGHWDQGMASPCYFCLFRSERCHRCVGLSIGPALWVMSVRWDGTSLLHYRSRSTCCCYRIAHNFQLLGEALPELLYGGILEIKFQPLGCIFFSQFNMRRTNGNHYLLQEIAILEWRHLINHTGHLVKCYSLCTLQGGASWNLTPTVRWCVGGILVLLRCLGGDSVIGRGVIQSRWLQKRHEYTHSVSSAVWSSVLSVDSVSKKTITLCPRDRQDLKLQ